MKNCKETKELKGHTSWVMSAQFSPCSNFVVTASADKTAKIWNVQSGEEVKELKGHKDWVLSAQFSPCGKFIITTSDDGTAKIHAVNI